MCHGGSCKNTPGSFKCECPAGFIRSSDGFSCMGKYEIPEYTAKVTQEYGIFLWPGYSLIWTKYTNVYKDCYYMKTFSLKFKRTLFVKEHLQSTTPKMLLVVLLHVGDAF